MEIQSIVTKRRAKPKKGKYVDRPLRVNVQGYSRHEHGTAEISGVIEIEGIEVFRLFYHAIRQSDLEDDTRDVFLAIGKHLPGVKDVINNDK